MKSFLLIFIAALGFASTEPKVSRLQLMEMESRMNDMFRTTSQDPYDLLGTTRGTYVEGYGVLFTMEVNLVYVSGPSPFRPAITPEEKTSLRERKLKKLGVLRDQLRQQMVSASQQLNGLPGNEKIAIEAFLWNYNWEHTAGLPRRIMLSADRQKLQDAKDGKTAAAVIEEREL